MVHQLCSANAVCFWLQSLKDRLVLERKTGGWVNVQCFFVPGPFVLVRKRKLVTSMLIVPLAAMLTPCCLSLSSLSFLLFFYWRESLVRLRAADGRSGREGNCVGGVMTCEKWLVAKCGDVNTRVKIFQFEQKTVCDALQRQPNSYWERPSVDLFMNERTKKSSRKNFTGSWKTWKRATWRKVSEAAEQPGKLWTCVSVTGFQLSVVLYYTDQLSTSVTCQLASLLIRLHLAGQM